MKIPLDECERLLKISTKKMEKLTEQVLKRLDDIKTEISNLEINGAEVKLDHNINK